MNSETGRATPSPTRVPLARDVPRLLFVPMLIALLGITVGGLAVLALPDPARLPAIAVGAVLAALALLAALTLLSVRLEVLTDGQVRLSWLTGATIFRLVPGPVTRVPLPERGRQPIRGRFGAFGLTVGSGALHEEEPATVVKLARATSLIAIPTDRGRLAVAPADEAALIAALTASARLQQAAPAAPAAPAAGAGPMAAQAARWPLSAAESPRPPLTASPPPAPTPSALARATPTEPSPLAAAAESAPSAPRLLSGIERHRLEMERAARAAAEAAAAADAARRVDEERSAVARRAEEERRAAAAAATRTAAPSAGGLLATAGALAQLRARIFAPRRLIRLPAARGALALSLAPTAVAGIAAALFLVPGIAVLASAAESGRLALGLLLAGPLSTVGSLLARYGWPRLAGLVAVSGLFALVLLIRAGLG